MSFFIRNASTGRAACCLARRHVLGRRGLADSTGNDKPETLEDIFADLFSSEPQSGLRSVNSLFMWGFPTMKRLTKVNGWMADQRGPLLLLTNRLFQTG